MKEKQTRILFEDKKIFSIIEGMLFAAGDSVKTSTIADALEISTEEAENVLDSMFSIYDGDDRGIRLVHTEDTWQLSTKPEIYPYVSRIMETDAGGGLSKAAMETLAIIAYQQPVTRVEIEQLRGVSSSSSIKNLLDRELIAEAGRKDAPGRPFFYKTTPLFLKSVHLESLENLPEFSRFAESFESENPEGNADAGAESEQEDVSENQPEMNESFKETAQPPDNSGETDE